MSNLRLPEVLTSTDPRPDIGGWKSAMFPLVLLACGCVSESASDTRAREAFQRGRNSVIQLAPVPVTVTVVGPVKHRNLLWADGLTLARAIIAAEYLVEKEPGVIFLTRGGQTMSFSAAQLLSGDEGPLLKPGDVIEIRP